MLDLEQHIGHFSVRPAVEAALQQIPQLQHLRSLSLYRTTVDATTLSSMSQVRELQLDVVAFDARGLGSMTQLQQLVLEHCSLAECAPEGHHAQAGEGDGEEHAENRFGTGRADAESLLSATGQLTQLQVLEVAYDTSESSVADARLPLDNFRSWEPMGLVLRHALNPAFSAFTASSQLQRLCLDGGEDAVIWTGAVAHMFPAGRQLMKLTALELSSEHLHFQHAWGRLDEGALRSIVSCCPRLQTLLHIAGLLEEGPREARLAVGRAACILPGTDTSPLLQLQKCRSLAVGGRAFNNRAAQVVAQMTQLTSLTWFCSAGFDSFGLSQLTALTDLQQLDLVPVPRPDPVPSNVHPVEVERVEIDISAMLGGGRLVLNSCHDQEGAMVSCRHTASPVFARPACGVVRAIPPVTSLAHSLAADNAT
jgi:hypothetical protein